MIASPAARPGRSHDDMDPDLRQLFHRLNNQLGIVLAHAELMEAKAGDEHQRTRAAQVVAAALEAMRLSRTIRDRTDDEPAGR